MAKRCSQVIVLDNEAKNRAVGRLVRIEQNGWTETGMPRYDIHMDDVRPVRYEYTQLNRRGIAII